MDHPRIRQAAKKVCIRQVCPGCYASTLDCDNYKRLFLNNGYCLTAKLQDASAIILVACAASNHFEQLCLEALELAQQRSDGRAEIIVGGCLTKRFRALIETQYRCLVFPSWQLAGLAECLAFIHPGDSAALRAELQAEYFSQRIRAWYLLRQLLNGLRLALNPVLPRLGWMLTRFCNTTYAYSRRAYFLRCSLGCAHHCSFCTTREARGFVQSRELASILCEMKLALKHNYDHFVLISEDITSYGQDIRSDFTVLIEAIFNVEGDFTVTMYNFNPTHCIAYLNRFLAAMPVGRIKCIHFPLQSGSNRILNRMNRKYTREQFVKAAFAILAKDPDISLRTDVILGFPGESEVDFDQSLSVLREVPFERVNLWCYEERPGTPSAVMPEAQKLPESVKQVRKRRAAWVIRKSQFRRWWSDEWGSRRPRPHANLSGA